MIITFGGTRIDLYCFVGAFTKFRKATVGFVVSVHMSMLYNFATTGRVFMKFNVFWKSFKKVQVSLKSDKNNWYFTRRRMYFTWRHTYFTQRHAYFYDSKGKSVPLQAWSGPDGSRKLRFPNFMTTSQDGGKVVSLTHWPPLHPGSAPGTHFR